MNTPIATPIPSNSASSALDTAAIVETASALIAMHPVYGSDGQRHAMDYLEQRMRALGASVRRRRIYDEEIEDHPCYVHVENFGGSFASYRETVRENLVCELDFGAPGPTVLLNGHVDVEFVTAPEQWSRAEGWRKPRVEDGRLYGRGSSDMLGAVACFVAVAEDLSRAKAEGAHLGGRLLLHFVVDEEIGGNGTLATLSTLDGQVDAALIGEPTDGAVCTRTRSFEQFKVVCGGRPRHMCLSEGSANALSQAVQVFTIIEELNQWCREQLGGDPVRSLCVGVLRGGSDAAVPAASAELLVTAALPPSLPLSAVLSELDSRLRAAFPDEAPQVGPYGLRFPASQGGHEGLAAGLRAQLEGVVELDPARREARDFPSACDARIFESFSIPTVIYGPGSLARAHGPDEYVSLDELKVYTRVIHETLRAAFSGDASLSG
ncbi:Acetylornithine deacetylase [Enhygromyxa salina]|uniref:Acetylornithine deacetylase n=1 Tax=Enhygromyxa salina TaxID=215803 RepID=A0A2S9XZG1_9BACT|nr:M20/M25/M40 family metallo-hydrolase [Enhygromyxa salina]PRP98258.1 Acetylornithine deacetylase [Enhygromyxa salina]